MSHRPEIKWAQTFNKVYITVHWENSAVLKKYTDVAITPRGKFTLIDCAEDKVRLKLFGGVIVEESKINVRRRAVYCILQKAESKWWRRFLHTKHEPPFYVGPDWSNWVDKGSEEATQELDWEDEYVFLQFGGTGVIDISKFHVKMGGDAMDDIDESDDEEQESKPTEDGKIAGEQDGVGKSAGRATTETKEAAPTAST